MRLARHVARTGEMRNGYEIYFENLNDRSPKILVGIAYQNESQLGRSGVHVRTTLKRILKKQEMRVCTGFN
jgi:hypothetical protein